MFFSKNLLTEYVKSVLHEAMGFETIEDPKASGESQSVKQNNKKIEKAATELHMSSDSLEDAFSTLKSVPGESLKPDTPVTKKVKAEIGTTTIKNPKAVKDVSDAFTAYKLNQDLKKKEEKKKA